MTSIPTCSSWVVRPPTSHPVAPPGSSASTRTLHRDYLRAFAAAGLDVDELFEPAPDLRWFELQTAAWSHAPEAFRKAFEGVPAAIVWSLVKR
jgi:hypothetical protein